MKRILWVEMTASYHFSPNPKLYNPMLMKIISLLYTYYQLRGTEKLSTHIGASSVSSWQFSSDEWYSALWTDGECGLPSTTRGITVNSTSEKRRLLPKPAVCISLVRNAPGYQQQHKLLTVTDNSIVWLFLHAFVCFYVCSLARWFAPKVKTEHR